jgi:hypothetical protein
MDPEKQPAGHSRHCETEPEDSIAQADYDASSNQANEKHETEDKVGVHDEVAPEVRGRELSELPKGYYYSPYFVGTYLVSVEKFTCTPS